MRSRRSYGASAFYPAVVLIFAGCASQRAAVPAGRKAARVAAQRRPCATVPRRTGATVAARWSLSGSTPAITWPGAIIGHS
jgi:hypothetical protein